MMAKEVKMTRDKREIHRKKRVLEYAERIGNINKACRYFGIAILGELELRFESESCFDGGVL